jgi:hypothetical protein
MKVLLSILVLLFSLLNSAEITSKECPVKIEYKQWFFQSPQGTVVGFPLRTKSAAEDGYDRFCSYSRMRARGIVRFYERNGGFEHNQDSLYFFYDPNSGSTAPDELVVIDSFAVTKGHKLYLYSQKEFGVDKELHSLCSGRVWNKGEESDARVYGYGVVGLSYYDHVGSWVSAESDAIRDMLGKSAVSVAAQQISSEQSFTEVIRYEYDLEVAGVTVERRWVDFDDWSCHVVVSAPVGAVVSWVQDSTDQLSDVAINQIDTELSNSDKSEATVVNTAENRGNTRSFNQVEDESFPEFQQRRRLEQREFEKEQAEEYKKFREQ